MRARVERHFDRARLRVDAAGVAPLSKKVIVAVGLLARVVLPGGRACPGPS